MGNIVDFTSDILVKCKWTVVAIRQEQDGTPLHVKFGLDVETDDSMHTPKSI